MQIDNAIARLHEAVWPYSAKGLLIKIWQVSQKHI
jgi:hypothetical protein